MIFCYLIGSITTFSVKKVKKETRHRAEQDLSADNAVGGLLVSSYGSVTEADASSPLQNQGKSQPTVFSSSRSILCRCFGQSAYSYQRTILSGASGLEKIVKIAMSAAQRRCQTLLLQSIAKVVDCQWQANSSIITRLTALQSAQPFVSLVPQQSWPLNCLARRHTSHKNNVPRDWVESRQQLFPRLAQHSFSQQAGVLCT